MYIYLDNSSLQKPKQEIVDLMNDIYIKAIKNFRCYNPKKGGFRTWFDQMVLNHLHEQIQD